MIGALQPVPGTDWVVVSSVDRAEALAPLKEALLLLAVVAFFLLTVMAMALLLLWRRTRETESLQLLARTAEQDRLLRVFYDLPFVGMAVLSPRDRDILQANARLARLVGHPDEDLSGRNWCDVLPGADPDEPAFRELIEGQREAWEREFTLTGPDGETAWLQFEFRVTRREDGTVEYLVALAEDVTERRRAHQALQRQKDLYDVLSQTNQAITRCHSDGALFATVCQVAVERGHLAFAWIGRIDPDSGIVTPVARYGDTTGYVDRIEVSVSGTWQRGSGGGS